MASPIAPRRAVDVEFERLQSEQIIQLQGGTATYRLQRAIVRTLRVASGLVLASLAVYSCSTASAKTDISFASLTLADLGVVLFGYGGAIAFTVWAFHAAFGEAPRIVRMSDTDLRAEAERRVLAQEQQAATEAASAAQEQERIAARYRRSRLIGLLFDPSIAKKHKWLPWVAWPLAYLIPFLLFTLFK